jgi:hypothetical protein
MDTVQNYNSYKKMVILEILHIRIVHYQHQLSSMPKRIPDCVVNKIVMD